MSWINDIKALVSADELAKDVAGAEAMVQRHKERKGEIDAQEDSFKASSQFGQSLISSGHYESDQVKDIVSFVITQGTIKVYSEGHNFSFNHF